MTKVLVQINDARWKNINLDIDAIINAALKNKNAEVSVLLTNDSEIRKLNKQYRQMDKPTNVLSFESGDPHMMGDIVLSYDTILAESDAQNFAEHAAHMLVHGALHLSGFDHIEDADAKKMERREVRILHKLGIKNPYETKWSPRLKAAAAFVLGALMVFGFAPEHNFLIALIALAAAYYMNETNNKFIDGFRVGFPFGAGFAIANFSWMIASFFVDATAAATFGWLAPFAAIGIMLGGGIVFGLPFALTAAMRDNGWRRPFYFAVFAALVLWMRGWMLSGFPWNPLGATLLFSDTSANIIGVIGIVASTFIVAGMAASLNKLKVALFFWPAFFILLLISNLNMTAPTDTGKIVRIVQPAIEQAYKSSAERADRNLETLIELSSLPGEFDLIVWPESSFPYPVSENAKINFGLTKPLIFGAIRRDSGDYFNSLFIMENGTRRYYDKIKLVPFGEYSPFGKMVPVPGDFTAGATTQGAMEISGISFAPSICYEIIFGNTYNEEYASAIINITNDGWFGKSRGPLQHLDLARLRAIETGLPVVRANWSGVSAIIDPQGRVLHKLDVGERGIIDAAIPAKRCSFYSLLPNGFMIVLIMLSSATLALTGIRGRRKKD
ncbi:MAG: apolipoprotein N-acyltransferase [Rickettsiales bacterium]|jgi:apolipoprotein N-acyltransferase|nr:apolipoprotein N-acyltransferase [Rickettsiales bacterium]